MGCVASDTRNFETTKVEIENPFFDILHEACRNAGLKVDMQKHANYLACLREGLRAPLKGILTRSEATMLLIWETYTRPNDIRSALRDTSASSGGKDLKSEDDEKVFLKFPQFRLLMTHYFAAIREEIPLFFTDTAQLLITDPPLQLSYEEMLKFNRVLLKVSKKLRNESYKTLSTLWRQRESITQKLFERVDINKDGKITRSEFMKRINEALKEIVEAAFNANPALAAQPAARARATKNKRRL